MLYEVFKKVTGEHDVKIMYSPELERKNINKCICCYAFVDSKFSGEAEFVPSSYPSCGDDFDEENEYTGFRFKYDNKPVFLVMNDLQERNFTESRSKYMWLEYKQKPFVERLYISLDDNKIVHFSFSEDEAKKYSKAYEEIFLTLLVENKIEYDKIIKEFNEVDCKDIKEPFYFNELCSLYDVCFPSKEYKENIIDRDEEIEF
jgi:hypothetical protein